MRFDREIARRHAHIANLAFSKIFEDPIGAESVGIAVLFASIASDNYYEGVAGWRNDAALLLTAIPPVNI